MAQRTVTIRLALEDADKVRRALEDLGDKGKAAIDKIDGASTQRLRADVDKLVRTMDPVERSAYALQQRLGLLDRALQQGAISQQDYARAAGLARTQHETLASSFQKVEQGAKLAAYQITNLGYQIQDAAVQLAGGQNPFLILMQQGPQAAGAVGGFSTLFRLMVSPAALATAGLLAFGGAAALVAARAVAINRELRTLQTTLRAYGSDSGSAEGLRSLAHGLTVSGADRSESFDAAQEVARRRTLSAALGTEIAGIAGNMAAATGQTVADAVKAVAQAVEGGYPAILKLDDSFNLLTADELRQVRAMAEHGDKARMLDTVMGALHRRFDGLRAQAMGPAERGLHDLGVAWNDLIEAIATSQPVMNAVTALARDMESLAKWVTGPTPEEQAAAEQQRLSERIVAENNRLLALKKKREQLAGLATTAGPQFAANPTVLADLDDTIAEQERRVAALIEKARAATKAAEAGPPAAGPMVAGAAGTTPSPVATASADAAARAEQERQRKIVDAAVDQYERLARTQHGTSVERELAVARMKAEDEALQNNLDGEERERLIATRLKEAKLALTTAVADLTRAAEAEIAGTLRIAAAYGLSAEAVRQATLAAKADQEVAKGSIETRDQILQRLRAQDEAQRRLNDAQKLADLRAEIEANRRLADALNGTVTALGAVERGHRAAADAAREMTTAASRSSVTVSARVHSWDSRIEPLADKYGVSADFVRRVMQQESGGRNEVVSSAGAIGVMQVMPATFAEVASRHGIRGAITDPLANLEAGIAYLAEQLRSFGSPDRAAAAYNAGPGRVRQHLDQGRPLPAETRAYVAAVTSDDSGGNAAAMRDAARDTDLYTQALERMRIANTTATQAQGQTSRSLDDTVRALHDAELRNQAYDLVRRQGLAGQRDENAALEYWLALLKEGERAQAAVAAGKARLDLQRQRQALEDEIAASRMPQAQGELWLAGRRDYARMIDLGGLQWSDDDRQRWLDEAKRLREREQGYAREKALIADLESFGDRAFDRIGEAMTQMAMEGANAWDTLRNVGKAVLSELMQEAFRFAVINPLKNLILGQNNPTLDDIFGRLGGVVSGWFGGGSVAGTSLAGGSAVSMLDPTALYGIYHEGGIVENRRASARSLPIALLASARRYHGGGWAGLEPDEIPAILQAGEAVLSRRQVAALRSESIRDRATDRPVTVVMNVSTPDTTGFRLSQGQIVTDAMRAMERAKRNL